MAGTIESRVNNVGSGSGTTSPLTTKGDLYGYSTGNARIPVGNDGQVLTSDSTQALGVKWSNVEHSVGSIITCATGSGSVAQTIDFSTARAQRLTLTGTGTCVLTFTNMVAGGDYILTVLNSGAAISWDGGVVWGLAGAPVLSASGLYDDFFFFTIGAGSVYHGSYKQGYSS